jgi:hypothetical protein
MLRRIMIKHKATMEPEHVADTVLCLQHLVRAARYAKRAGIRPGTSFMHQATSQARSQPRVRANGEFSRSKVRSSESDGHMEQLMAQMLGELGSMIWFMVSVARADCFGCLLGLGFHGLRVNVLQASASLTLVCSLDYCARLVGAPLLTVDSSTGEVFLDCSP